MRLTRRIWLSLGPPILLVSLPPSYVEWRHVVIAIALIVCTFAAYRRPKQMVNGRRPVTRRNHRNILLLTHTGALAVWALLFVAFMHPAMQNWKGPAASVAVWLTAYLVLDWLLTKRAVFVAKEKPDGL